MSKGFIGIIAAIIIVVIGIIVVSENNANAPSGNGTPTSHIKGDKNSPVKLVEYGDYQCPGCGAYYTTIKAVNDKYDKQISFQFINFPLTSIHPNTFAASRAAEAAGMQGKYWQMHDVLYQQNQAYYVQQQQTWITASNPMPLFENYATEIGLNLAQFKKDYASEKVNNSIQADKAKGDKAGVDATPTFFLDGKQLDTSTLTPDITAFSKLIDKALAENAKSSSKKQSTSSSQSTTTTKKATTKNQ